MMSRRVVVTGMGMLTALGASVEQTWAGILAGKSGIRAIDHFDASAFSTQFAGTVLDFVVEDYLPAKEARRVDAFIQYGLAAGQQALVDSGLLVTDANWKTLNPLRQSISIALYPFQRAVMLPRDATFLVHDWYSAAAAIKAENEGLQRDDQDVEDGPNRTGNDVPDGQQHAWQRHSGITAHQGNQQRKKQKRTIQADGSTLKIVKKIKSHEYQELDAKFQQIGNHGGKWHNHPRKINLAKYGGILFESVRGIRKAGREIIPDHDACQIKQKRRHGPCFDSCYFIKNDGKSNRGKQRLDQVPQRSQNGLFVNRDDVPFYEQQQ